LCTRMLRFRVDMLESLTAFLLRPTRSVVPSGNKRWLGSRYAIAMSGAVASITSGLECVQKLRAVRAADESLTQRVAAIKGFQHQRFEHDYAELLANPRYAAAARFFLEDLYGPKDFSARDAQFSKIVPVLSRVLPDEVVHTVVQLIELHVLSEQLDQQMAQRVEAGALDRPAYANAWRAVGRRDDRERQVALMLDVGHALDRHTRKPLLGTTLRLARGPARAAGLGDLQEFLQNGYTAFKAMKGAEEFLKMIARNERAQIDALFAA